MIPPGSWLAPQSFHIDLRVSADPVDVRNDPQSRPPFGSRLCKKEGIQASKRPSEILLLVKSIDSVACKSTIVDMIRKKTHPRSEAEKLIF